MERPVKAGPGRMDGRPHGRHHRPRMLPAVLVLLALLTLALVQGCGGDGSAEDDAERAPAAGSEEGTMHGDGFTSEPEVVTFTTGDGLTLSGRVFGSGTVAVVLAHMYPADQESWAATARELAAGGYLALTFDFRGYGDSEGDKEITLLDEDVEAAVRTVESLGARRVGLVGASMGGTAVLMVAARLPVAAVACLSAPVEFEGLSAQQAIGHVTAPKLFLAAEDDVGAQGAERLFAAASDTKEIHILPGDDHGTDLLTGSSGQQAHDLLMGFLRTHLPAAPEG